MKDSDPKDPQVLAESLAGRSNADLHDMINLHSKQYRQEALVMARAEMIRRGYHVSKSGKVTDWKEDDETRTGPAEQVGRKPGSPSCLRCKMRLEYLGTRQLHEDKSMSVLGELGEMFKNGTHEFLDVYVCRNCGHVDLFVDGIGEQFRPY